MPFCRIYVRCGTLTVISGKYKKIHPETINVFNNFFVKEILISVDKKKHMGGQYGNLFSLCKSSKVRNRCLLGDTRKKDCRQVNKRADCLSNSESRGFYKIDWELKNESTRETQRTLRREIFANERPSNGGLNVDHYCCAAEPVSRKAIKINLML